MAFFVSTAQDSSASNPKTLKRLATTSRGPSGKQQWKRRNKVFSREARGSRSHSLMSRQVLSLWDRNLSSKTSPSRAPKHGSWHAATCNVPRSFPKISTRLRPQLQRCALSCRSQRSSNARCTRVTSHKPSAKLTISHRDRNSTSALLRAATTDRATSGSSSSHSTGLPSHPKPGLTP
jgi:hypothetical protein